MRVRGHGGSRSRATTSSGTRTSHAGISVVSIPRPAKVTEWLSPSGPKSEPYGISAINDIIWYSESGTTPNTVVRFDPQTEKFQSWAIPVAATSYATPRSRGQGDFVLANSLVNAVTLVKISK